VPGLLLLLLQLAGAQLPPLLVMLLLLVLFEPGASLQRCMHPACLWFLLPSGWGPDSGAATQRLLCQQAALLHGAGGLLLLLLLLLGKRRACCLLDSSTQGPMLLLKGQLRDLKTWAACESVNVSVSRCTSDSCFGPLQNGLACTR
jgi:hypothetical protein